MRSAALALLACALAAGVAGCREKPAAQRPTGDRIELAEHDFYFDPQVVKTHPGRFAFELVDRGRLAHNFRLEKRGREIASASAIKPGESERVTVRLTRGDYRYFCSVGNHEELGMYGTVVVR